MSEFMITYEKAKSYEEADRIKDFITHKGYGAIIKKNQGFFSDEYPYEVVGNDEGVVELVKRHNRVVDVFTDEVKREATWNKPKNKWDEEPKRIQII